MVMNDKKYWLFYSGLALIVIGFVAMNFMQEDASDYQHYIITSIIKRGYVFALLMGSVVAPVCEELTFRYWSRGTILARIVSLVGMSFCVLQYGSFTLSAIFTIVMLLVFFVLKFRVVNIWFIVSLSLSSFLFAIMHQTLPLSMKDVVCMLTHIGFSFIALYLTMRWNIFVAMALHSVWNLIIIGSILLFLNGLDNIIATSYRINSDMFSVNIMRKANINDGHYSKTVVGDSLILKNASITQMIKVLSEDEDDYILIENIIDELFKFDLSAWVIDKANLLIIRDSIIANYYLKFDTLMPSSKFILIDYDASKRVNYTDEYISLPISYIESTLNRVSRRITVFRNTLECVTVSNECFDMLGSIKNEDNLISILEKEGLSFVDPTTTCVKFVVIN